MMNLRINNSSGVTGVSWNKHNSMWRAKCNYNNKTSYLGSFKDFKDAVSVRQGAEKAFLILNELKSKPLTIKVVGASSSDVYIRGVIPKTGLELKIKLLVDNPEPREVQL